MICLKDKQYLRKLTISKLHYEITNAYDFMFTKIIGGHPIAICLAANYYKHESLENLYKKMSES